MLFSPIPKTYQENPIFSASSYVSLCHCPSQIHKSEMCFTSHQPHHTHCRCKTIQPPEPRRHWSSPMPRSLVQCQYIWAASGGMSNPVTSRRHLSSQNSLPTRFWPHPAISALVCRSTVDVWLVIPPRYVSSPELEQN